MDAIIFYEYGGMKIGQKTKLHICDDFCKVLCGVKSFWMESGEVINKDGFVNGFEHLFPITDESSNTCKKCLKKWQKSILKL